MSQPRIGVILSAWKRTELLAEQLLAIRRQSVPADTVLIWHNPCEGQRLPTDLADNEHVVSTTLNRGVWGRFSILTMLDTDYLHVIDDDTIPGHEWFRNCLDVMGLLPRFSVVGTCGRLFPEGGRSPCIPVGWQNPGPQTMYADVLNHSWFFGRELAEEFVPTGLYGQTCGEDYAICALARKRGGVVACPPHPLDQMELWGSLRGMDLGSDSHALWLQDGEEERKRAVHDDLRKRGWKVAAEVYL